MHIIFAGVDYRSIHNIYSRDRLIPRISKQSSSCSETTMFSRPLKRCTFPRLLRPFSGAGYTTTRTPPRGLSEILEKRPEDVVITFAKRTAMSRAKKGQLNDVPVDKLLHSLFRVRPFGLLRPITRLDLSYRQPLRKPVWTLQKLTIFAWVGRIIPFWRSASE